MTAIKPGGIRRLFSGASHGPWFFRRTSTMAAVMTQGIRLGLVGASLASSTAAAQERASPSTVGVVSVALPEAEALMAHAYKRATFQGVPAANDVRQAADWVVDSGDNRGLPFVIVEKKDAEVFVFDAQGQILGAAPALVGLAPGDDSVPGIGDRPLAGIRPEERTTPAGRFVASLGHDLGELDVLWVDYADAISLHRVITTNPRERRLQRLATPTPLDNRISYGCINVPKNFFEHVVQSAFTGTNGIVYILPEIKSMGDVFPTYYDVDEHSQMQNVKLPAPAIPSEKIRQYW
jgi:hypothetical protein